MASLKQDQVIVVQGNVPAFLLKLWKIVEDDHFDHLISWSKNGRAFKVHDQIEFAKEILPRFYKHNNFSSFVRQVNMYGFRKIVDPSSGSLKLDRDEWEFSHPYFQQSKPDQLHLIKRKVHVKEDTKSTNAQMVNLLQDVEKLKNQAEDVNSRLDLVKAENELLWREVSDLRETHQNQQTVINKLIQFFIQLVMSKGDISRKRRALDYPFLESKFKKSQELQPYDASKSALSKLLQDPIYTMQSPSDNRLIELSRENILASETLPNIATVISDEIIDEGLAPAILPASPTLSTDVPDLSTGTLTYGQNYETPFIFPEVYQPSVSTGIISSGTLTTPTVTVPDKTPTSQRPNIQVASEGLSTPVISMPPAVSRQKSFNHRQEIVEDVDRISKSIGFLQDMLKTKQINIDLSGLELPGHDLTSQVSVQDLIRLSQNEDDIETQGVIGNSLGNKALDNGGGEEGQLIPYTAPFSPSQLIDSEYATAASDEARSDFFENVFDENES